MKRAVDSLEIGRRVGAACSRPLLPFPLMGASLETSVAQVDVPEPLLPDEGGAIIWPNVLLLVVVVAVAALVAWRLWAYVRDTRRTADEALEGVAELRGETRERSA